MAGGAGTRLWPLSRDEKPKQFHNLSGNGTLMKDTITRLQPLSPDHAVIVTSEKYRELSLEELNLSGLPGTVLCEPRPRNTAAAVLYAAAFLSSMYPDSIMIVLPADHYIKNNQAFADVLSTAVQHAFDDSLVTIGIMPSYPETGYGYIKADAEDTGQARRVERFVEKPDFEKAREYVESGNYFWNSGIFVWKTSVILDSFRGLLPAHYKKFQPLFDLSSDEISSDSDKIFEIKQNIFNALESVSIDNGILEKAENRVVIPADFGWADLGSWKAMDDILEADEDNNRSLHRENAIFVSSSGCTAISETMRISIAGLSDITVVESGGEILVIHKDASQHVREVVDRVRKKNS